MKLNHMLSYSENYFSILGTTLVYATEFVKEGNCTNFVNISLLPWTKETADCTEVRFSSFFSGGFITAIVANPPEKKLAKHTSVDCCIFALDCDN